MSSNMKIIGEFFIWKIVTKEQALTLIATGVLPVFQLYDNAEAQVETVQDWIEIANNNPEAVFGIEVGNLITE